MFHIKKTLYLGLIVILFQVAMLSSCVQEDRTTVLWDDYHVGVFPPWKFSKFIKIIEKSGGEIKYITEDFEKIEGKALVICGPRKSFSEGEIEKIKDFAKNGGKVLILVHLPPSINLGQLLSELGFSYGNTVVYQKVNGKFTKEIFADVFSEKFRDGIFYNVGKIALFGSFYIRNNTIACAKGYADNNGDGFISEHEKNCYGVVGYKKYGKGEIIIIMDDALFLDKYITTADNIKFAENIAKWLLK